MKPIFKKPGRLLATLALGLALLLPWVGLQAAHDIRGITGPTFNLYAFPFNMNLPDGSSVHMWGFGDQDAGAPMDVLVNGTLIAHGEIVIVDDQYGVRLTDVVSPVERIEKLH